MKNRTETKVVNVGNVAIGGFNEIVIQTMTTCKTSDVDKTINEINSLARAGAQLVRVSVLDENDLSALSKIVSKSLVPIVVDIHFNHLFAIKAIQAGVAKIRINPGNIGTQEQIYEILREAKKHDTAIRIGINGGSLSIDPWGSRAGQLVACAFKWIKFFKKHDFHNLVVSIKDSDPNITYKANLALAKKCKYPIHLGVTEAGPGEFGIVKSCIALIPLLEKGVGNTIRISINGNRLQEIKVAKALLNNMGFNVPYYNVIACPVCGRNLYDTKKWVNEIDKYLKEKHLAIKIAIMGCIVNGPGESKTADLSVCVKDKASSIIYDNGKQIATVSNNDVVKTLKELIDKKYNQARRQNDKSNF